MIILLCLFGAAVVLGLCFLLVRAIYGGGYSRGYRNGKVDGERRGWFKATGDWPEEPERRPGVMER